MCKGVKYRSDNLFITSFSEEESLKLHEKSINDLKDLQEIIDINL